MPANFTFPNMAGMPASIDLPKETQLWVPLALPAAPSPASSDLSIVGELKPNMDLAQARKTCRPSIAAGWKSIRGRKAGPRTSFH